MRDGGEGGVRGVRDGGCGVDWSHIYITTLLRLSPFLPRDPLVSDARTAGLSDNHLHDD